MAKITYIEHGGKEHIVEVAWISRMSQMQHGRA